MLSGGDVIVAPDAYSAGKTFRLYVTVSGVVVVSTNGIVTLAVRTSVVCLSVSDREPDAVLLDAVAFVGSRTQFVGCTVPVVAFDEPLYAESATIVPSNWMIVGASSAGDAAPTTTRVSVM